MAKMLISASAKTDAIFARIPVKPKSSGPSTLIHAQPISLCSLLSGMLASQTMESSSSVRVMERKSPFNSGMPLSDAKRWMVYSLGRMDSFILLQRTKPDRSLRPVRFWNLPYSSFSPKLWRMSLRTSLQVFSASFASSFSADSPG